MSELKTAGGGRVFDHEAGLWRDVSSPARWTEPEGWSPGWVIAGVAAVALGALAWYHFGGDLKRYIKMERM